VPIVAAVFGVAELIAYFDSMIFTALEGSGPLDGYYGGIGDINGSLIGFSDC
jgi:hypothetical protein